MVATKFSTAKAKKALGPGPVENTPKGMAEAFGKILRDQDFEVNEVEVLRWCEFQFNRRYRFIKDMDHKPDTITVDTLITNFRTYMGNWYDQHRKWLRASS